MPFRNCDLLDFTQSIGELLTDVSGRSIVLIFKGPNIEDGTVRLSRNVGGELPLYTV